MPRPITQKQIKSKYIQMSASESLSLIRNISLIIRDKVPKNNEHQQLVILLKEITEIITSPLNNDGIIDVLDSLYTEYLDKLVEPE